MSKRITNPLVGLHVSKNIEDLDKIRNKMNAQVQKIQRHEKVCGDIIYDVLCLNALLPCCKAQDKLQRSEALLPYRKAQDKLQRSEALLPYRKAQDKLQRSEALLPYRKAQDKLQRAEDTSNLETDDEELLKKRRRCGVNYMTLYTGA